MTVPRGEARVERIGLKTGILLPEEFVRGAIIAVAVLLYAAAIAVFGAGMRLQPPAATSLIASPAPSAPPSPPSASPPAPAAPPAAGAEAERLRLAMLELAREQAANRELVRSSRASSSAIVKPRPPPNAPAGRLPCSAAACLHRGRWS